MIDYGISGKSVLITGANNPMGIGAAAARAFADVGASVFLHYYRPPGAEQTAPEGYGLEYYAAMQARTAQHLVDEIRQHGGQAEALEWDLGDPAAPGEIFEAAERTLGPVEILVNNAAHSTADTFGPVADGDRAADGFGLFQHAIGPESLDRHFKVNARAAALLMSEFFQRHHAAQRTWGRIINISTDAAAGFAGEVSYGASKYALESLSRAAAKEMGQFGITVNIASLGPIQTGWMSPELERAVAENTPLGRAGLPEEVADVLVFLASNQARWLTGQTIYVGGGHRMGQ
jgi:3-oxoacyl-[acyl-carrier protein] reductase